jgi:hypothetical protein
MDVNTIQQLNTYRENGNMTDVEYLRESKKMIHDLVANSPEAQSEKNALLACLESLEIRAHYWEKRQRDELGNEIESWLTVAVT